MEFIFGLRVWVGIGLVNVSLVYDSFSLSLLSIRFKQRIVRWCVYSIWVCKPIYKLTIYLYFLAGVNGGCLAFFC